MYRVSKRIEISCAHWLDLTYESPCRNVHGHNFIIYISVQAEKLDDNGMVIDFRCLKDKIHSQFDHSIINDIVKFNPTAENLAKWIADEVNVIRKGADCYKVVVQESEGNFAEWSKD